MSRPNLVIGGSSHVGKSTLGVALGTTLGWEVLSTDAMARHPGRPWPEVRPHVAEFYASLSHESILTFLRHHHENMWPHIRNLLCDRFAAGTPCILEGSALRPEFLATLPEHQNACVCLVAPAVFIVQRIHANSGYNQCSPDACRLIDVFVERSLRENDAMLKAAMELEIAHVDASDPDAVAQLHDRLIAAAIGTAR